jgi:RHS repeat-associated protein
MKEKVMKFAKLAVLVILSVGNAAPLRAQTAPDLENGFKNYGSYDGSHLDTVNLMNGGVILHAPLLPGYPQRGNLKLQAVLIFNSKTWQVICADNQNLGPMCGWFHGGTGVTLNRPMDIGIQRTIHNFFSGTQVLVTAEGYTLTGADGATHQLMPTVVTNGVDMELESIDTTGFHVVMSAPDANGVPSTATITDRQGNQYVAVFDATGDCGQLPYNPPLPWAGGSPNMGGGYAPMIDDTPRGDQFCPQIAGGAVITDSNGNMMRTYDPGDPTYAGVDTLGRAIPLGAYTLTSDYNGCVSQNSITAAYQMNYNAPDGTTRQIKMCFAPVPMQTAFNQAGVVEYPGGPSLPPGSNRFEPGNQLPPMATIILGDGTKWVFNYDNYGELSSVTLPSGGSISYTWTTIGTCNGGLTQKSRAVATRTLDDGQGHTYKWTYTWGTPNGGAALDNLVSDPAGNDTEHVFTPVDGLCAFYESTTKFYQGIKSPAHLIKQIDTTYYPFLPYSTESGDTVAGNVVPKDITTTVYPSGKTNKIHREYDNGLGTNQPIFGNVVKELQYDWGQGQPGALLRETDTIYQWQRVDASGNRPYLTADLLDLPASVVVVSPNPADNTKTGCPITPTTTGNCMSETDYLYDEPSYVVTPTPAVTTQHNSASPYGVRGDLTTTSHWLSTTNSFISDHTKWYDTGERYQQVDPLGHTTTISYDPFYVGAYGTQTCSPQTGTVTHCVSGTYDFNTGVLTSLTNENATSQANGNTPGDSAHTTNYSYDYMFRLTSAQAPPDPANNSIRPRTDFTFSTPGTLPITVQRTKSVTTSLTDSATNFFDGLVRVYKAQHALPSGTASIDTMFDAAGHPATVSNAYFSVSDPTYGITMNQYDALDRVSQVTKQDGSVSYVNYDVVTSASVLGNCNTAIDEVGKQRRTCSDSLGRVVEVDEPNPGAQAIAAQGSFTINGTLKSQSGVGAFNAAAGSGSLTITGTERSVSSGGGTYCAMWNNDGDCVDWEMDPPLTTYDTGRLMIAVNGHSTSTTFDSASTVNNLASALASAINGDTGAFVNASASNAVLTLTARQTGASTNYSWSISSTSDDPADFGSAGSYSGSPASGVLSGGTNGSGGVTVYDTGTVAVAVGSFTASAPYSQSGNNTAAQVAAALAGSGSTGLNRSGSPVSATVSGATITLTYNTAGAAGNGIVISSSSQSTQTQWTFSPPSFTSTGTTLANGLDAGDVNNSPLVTQYQYDPLGNLTCVEQHGGVSGTGCSAAPSSDATSAWRVRRFTYDSLSRLVTAKNPESGTISYAYDNDSNLLQKTSPAPNQTGTATQTISYCYDELHRVTGKGYGALTCPLSSAVVSYTYDSGSNAKGKLTQMTDQAGTATYGYDMLSRLISETRSLVGANAATVSKSLSYEYSLDGSLWKLHYPSGAVLTFTPWNNGSVAVSSPQEATDTGNGINYITGATYGPDLSLTGFVSGSGGPASITNSFSYNKRLQPLTMSASTPSQTVFSIGYDFHAGNGTPGSGTDNGNVYGIYNYRERSRDQSFTYDALNRLRSAQNAGTNCASLTINNKTEYWGNSYSYDAWGNLLGKAISKCGAENFSVTADAHNWIHAAAPDYQYDAAGNMTFDATSSLSYTFDQENRVLGAAGYTYTYDGDGNRVIKANGTAASSGTLYWYMTPGVVAESNLAGTLKSEYIFFDGERVARKDFPANTVAYYFSDHLKTASVITDAAGTIKAESDYYPWGGELQFVNNDSNDYKFGGHKRDTETGLDYMGARYYNNPLGRFITPDWAAKPVAIPYALLGDPQTLNLYAYVGGNPASKTDPDGHDSLALSFDNYHAAGPLGIHVPFTGHAAVVTIDSKGNTRGFEYGRYDKAQKGTVRELKTSKVTMKNGKPTEASLKNLLKGIAKQEHNYTGTVSGAYYKMSDKDTQKVAGYALKREAQNSDANRTPYNLGITGKANNCATFCRDAVHAGGADTSKAENDIRPTSVIGDMQKKSDMQITYDAKKDKLTETEKKQ